MPDSQQVMNEAPQVHNRPTEPTVLGQALLDALKPDEAVPGESKPPDEAAQPAAVPDEAPQAVSESPDEVQQVALEDIWDIEVDIANSDEKITVGELKNRYQDFQSAEQLRAKVETERDDWRREQMLARQQLEALFMLLPEEHRTPERLQQAHELVGGGIQQERQRTLSVFPEWADESIEDRDRRLMHEQFWSNYGLSLGEVKSMADHRVLKASLDIARQAQRLSSIKADPERQKAIKPKPKAPPRSSADMLASIKADKKAGRITEDEALTLTLAAALQGQKHGSQQRSNR